MTSSVLRATALVARVLPQRARDSLYHLGPVSRAIRSLLTRAAPEGLSEVKVAAGPLEDAVMQLDLNQEKDLWLGTYEPSLMQAIEDFVWPGMTVYDIGANVGYVSLALARRVGERGRVFAFEPYPPNLIRLQHNLALNDIGARVDVVGAAVGERSGRAVFLTHRSGGMGKLEVSEGRDTQYAGTLSVEVVALDDWIGEGDLAPPDLMKIDVEGGETLVLAGATRTLERIRPMILIELHGPEAAEGAIRILESANYRLLSMQSGYPALSVPMDWKTYAVAQPSERE